MDYNIKLKYGGMGKQASVGRKAALQMAKQERFESAQAKLEGRTPVGKSSGGISDLTAIRGLTASIQKLTEANKSLEKTFKSSSPGVGGGGKPGGIPFGGSAGFGNMGASIPILGAAIAALGFTIQKVNEIGNAYIEKTSQQIGNVGIGGFRRSAGTYMGAEVGAGMKAYGMATGRFANRLEDVPNKTALNVGTVYGLSAEESLGTAGKFKRAGANYEGTVNQGLGMGIQSELPILLQGMAGMFEEAMRSGIDTSDMGKNMAKSLTSLTMNTPGKSVEAALNIAKSFTGVKTGLERGNMNSLEGMYGAQAIREKLMTKITGQGGVEYLKGLKESGQISEEQFQKSSLLGPGASFQDLQKSMGGVGANYLFKKESAETSSTDLGTGIIKQYQKKYGTGPESRQQFAQINAGGSLGNVDQINALWDTTMGKNVSDMTGKGNGIIESEAEKVRRSEAGMGINRGQQREKFLIDYGQEFADASMKMEESMRTMAEKGIPVAVSGIELLGNAAVGLSSKIETITKLLGGNTGPRTMPAGVVDATIGLFQGLFK